MISEHAALIITLFVAPRVPLATVTLACLIALGLSTLLLAVMPTPRYKRTESEAVLTGGVAGSDIGKTALN